MLNYVRGSFPKICPNIKYPDYSISGFKRVDLEADFSLTLLNAESFELFIKYLPQLRHKQSVTRFSLPFYIMD